MTTEQDTKTAERILGQHPTTPSPGICREIMVYFKQHLSYDMSLKEAETLRAWGEKHQYAGFRRAGLAHITEQTRKRYLQNNLKHLVQAFSPVTEEDFVQEQEDDDDNS